MTQATGPGALLARLVRTQASGEFIAVSEGLEVHVFLQHGRIAWGTTTASRFVFRKHLVDVFHVDPTTLREVLEDCQRSRKPLGETLMQWGVLTLEQVREALRAQVLATLGSLRKCVGGQALFLPREGSYDSYDQRLTFELAETLPQPTAPSSTVSPDDVLTGLRDTVPNLQWAAVLSERTLLATMGAGQPVLLPELGPSLTDADVLLIRSSRGHLVGGQVTSGGLSAWCGVLDEDALPNAWWAISSLGDRQPAPDACTRGAFLSFGSTSLLQEDFIPGLLEQATCPIGAVVLDGPNDVWATARRPIDPRRLAEQAILRQRAIDVDVFDLRAAPSPLAYQQLLIGDAKWWWFGADLPARPGSSAWLVLPRSANQSLGWALLSTVTRRLGMERSHD